MKQLAVIAALSLTAALVAPRAAEAKTLHQDVADATRAVSVKLRLIEKLGAEALAITVSVSGKTATLGGLVAKPASQLAGQVALSVDGIEKVDNQVTESAAPGRLAATEASLKNATLELRVKSVLLGEIGANALHVEVEAVDGVVSLRGKLAARDTAAVAVRTTRAVKGVVKVVDLLT